MTRPYNATPRLEDDGPDLIECPACAIRYTPSTIQVLAAARLLMLADQYDQDFYDPNSPTGYDNASLGQLCAMVQNWNDEDLAALRQWQHLFDHSAYVRQCIEAYEHCWTCDGTGAIDGHDDDGSDALDAACDDAHERQIDREAGL